MQDPGVLTDPWAKEFARNLEAVSGGVAPVAPVSGDASVTSARARKLATHPVTVAVASVIGTFLVCLIVLAAAKPPMVMSQSEDTLATPRLSWSRAAIGATLAAGTTLLVVSGVYVFIGTGRKSA